MPKEESLPQRGGTGETQRTPVKILKEDLRNTAYTVSRECGKALDLAIKTLEDELENQLELETKMIALRML